VLPGAHTGVEPVHGLLATWSHPEHTLLTQKRSAAFAVQSPFPTHSTHCPASGPVLAQAGLVPLQALAPAFWHPVHAFCTQNPLAASFVHWAFPTHSTHCPASAPLVAHEVLPSVRPLHPVAPAVLHPVHAFATQNPLPASPVHCPSTTHATHCPMCSPAVAHTVLPSARPTHPDAPGVVQLEHTLATQKLLAASPLQCPSLTHSTH